MPKDEPAMGLLPLFQEAHRAVRGHAARPTPWITFYPYASTTSTLRERDGRLVLRVSDHLRAAPDEVLYGLFVILVVRLFRVSQRRLGDAERAMMRRYDAWVESDDARERRSASRARRGRRRIEPKGEHRSLTESYLRVVLETGLDLPEPPTLSWSRSRSRSRFGYHDADHDCIVLSRILDDPSVPEFVLDYVVYHEILHILHPPVQGKGSKRIIHHKRFRNAEARFARRAEAEKWLDRLARRR